MKGNQLWEKAKTIIPGGGQLLSKRSEKFLPDQWPSYYSKASGYNVWGIDGQKYIDFAQMGVGSCVLGYTDPDVNSEVIKAIEDSSMSSLNCFEEVELAELIISLHPWSEMARFARTGGEACAIAVRIARAASGKDKVAFCGYHGWHDWYLSSNIEDSKNLDQQLLSGLSTDGVPKALKSTALPFNYNKLDELENHVSNHGSDIGVIMIEPQRDREPNIDFLSGIRAIADKIGAVLIYDEVTSGFRMNCGGIHLNRDIYPDIAVFGKALGNGFPISAIIGTRSVMENAQNTFISSTMWTERIGSVAALNTIKKFQKYKVHEKLIKMGNLMNDGWERLASKNGLDIKISGIPPLTHISFKEFPIESQTYYTQEMLKKGYLLGASVYMSYIYDSHMIEKFIYESDEVFSNLRGLIDKGDLMSMIDGDLMHTGFQRLT